MATYKERYNWIDVLKGFSMFFIIYSHLGSNPLSVFFFTFMVQAFFFASGLTSERGLEKNFKQFVTARFKRLIVPYFAFGIFAIAVKLFVDTHETFSMADMVKQLLYAYRMNTFAITLWFLPCLFVMGIYYYAVAKLIKNKWARLALCVVLSFGFRLVTEGNTLPWGIDNAVRYLVYYAAGNALADFFNGLSRKPSLVFAKKWPLLVLLASAGIVYIQYGYGANYLLQLVGLPAVSAVHIVVNALYAMNSIVFFSFLAIFMQDVKGLQHFGRQSLAVCCLDLPVNRFVMCAFSAVGLPLQLAGHGNLLVVATILSLTALKAADFVTRYFPVVLGFSTQKAKEE